MNFTQNLLSNNVYFDYREVVASRRSFFDEIAIFWCFSCSVYALKFVPCPSEQSFQTEWGGSMASEQFSKR